MSDQNSSRLDVSTVANVVNGVINALGLQPNQSSIQSGSTSTAAATQSRRVTSCDPPMTPSVLGKRRRKSMIAKSSKFTIWDREVICLPKSYMDLYSSDGVLPIPRKKKDILASFDLVGKVHLESEWSAAKVVAEIKSIFNDTMNDEECTFKFLQFTGTGTKSLIVPKVSASYRWTPKEVAGRADRPVYILLQKDLYNENEIRRKLLGKECTDVSIDPAKTRESRPSPIVLYSESSSAPASPFEQPSPSSTVSVYQSIDTNLYQEFIDLLSDSSEEFDMDACTQTAIQASLQQQHTAPTTTRIDSANPTMIDILTEHFRKYPELENNADSDTYNKIHVRCNHIWGDTLRAVTKCSFNPINPLRVTFIGEPAVDEGGPRREFFSLVLAKIACDKSIFHGSDDSRTFVRNVQGLQNRLFYIAGMLVAISLANGGPKFPCLSQTIYSYLCHAGKIQPVIEDITDIKVKEHLLKVCNVKDTAELQQLLLDDDADYISNCGFLKPTNKVNVTDVPEIMEVVCTEYVIMRTINEVQQFESGLNVLEVGSLIKRYPEEMKEIFVHNPQAVTASILDQIFTPQFSPPGSNARDKEEAIILNWKDFIYEAEECGVSISKIMMFVTGVERVPPMGFPLKPTISFLPDDGIQTLPTASTCSLILRFPLSLVNYEDFKEKMKFAVLNTIGFGQI